MADPRYSTMWPTPPPVPMRPMIVRMTSLAVTPGGQVALDGDGHGARPPGGDGLGGEDVLHLAGADAEGQGPEGPVGRRVAVAAHDRHPRLGEAQLGADDVDDALPGRPHGVERDPVLGAVVGEGLQLAGGDGVGEGEVEADGGRVVVGRGQGEVGPAHGAAGQAQAVEGLGRGDLVDQVEVDVEQVGLVAGAGVDHVLVPHLLRQGLALVPHLGILILAIWEQYRGSACSTRRSPSSTPWRGGRWGWGTWWRPPACPGPPPTAWPWPWRCTAWSAGTARAGSALGPRLTGRELPVLARPALERLRDATGESVQLYVRRGDRRLCVASLESPHGLRTIVPVGASLPLDVGSAGKVLRGELVGGRRRVGGERRGAGAGRGVGQRPRPRPRGRGGGRGVGVGAHRAHDPVARPPVRAGPGRGRPGRRAGAGRDRATAIRPDGTRSRVVRTAAALASRPSRALGWRCSGGGRRRRPTTVARRVADAPPSCPQPAPRWRGRLGSGRIVVVGGLTEAGVASDRVDVYDPVANRWDPAPALPLGLHHVGLATVGDRVYVAGGYHNPQPAGAVGGPGRGAQPRLRASGPGGRSRRWPRPGAGWPWPRWATGWWPSAAPARAGVLRRTEVLVLGASGGWRPGPTSPSPATTWPRRRPGDGSTPSPAAKGHSRATWPPSSRGTRRPADGWQPEPGLNDTRGGTSAAEVGGRPCVAGGEEPRGTIASVECLVDGRWERVATLARAPPRPGRRRPGGRLHVIGGGPQPGLFVSTAHEVFDVP